MVQLTLTERAKGDLQTEIVERKGIGHPDTICDALAELLSRNLSHWYLDNTGAIQHHNVDKALLRGGKSLTALGHGEVLEPIDIYLAGRATIAPGHMSVPVETLAVEGSRAWLREHLRALDVEKHVRIHCLVRQGSAELTDLFARAQGAVPKANDTSFGVGYAPDSRLESAVLKAGTILDQAPRPAWGEDTKIMAVRHGDDVSLSIACAMIAGQVANAEAYLHECEKLADRMKCVFSDHGFAGQAVAVNAADDAERGVYYLTATGTSAEAGDDGQVGRGNRANGLITPGRPMSLEAVCGKNPVNHVGKLYNVAARDIALQLVSECAAITDAQCCLVSQIGRPINEPAIVDVAISTNDGSPPHDHRTTVRAATENVLNELPQILDRIMKGEVQLY